MKEGYPSLICSTCIERLRVAYDFRLVCLQSDHTLSKYLEHLSINNKQKIISERPLSTPTKFEFPTSSTQSRNSPVNDECQQNVEYLHLKHFLDSDDEISRSETLLSKDTSRFNSPDSTSTGAKQFKYNDFLVQATVTN